jgi:AraC-like DNA-binding protein
MMIELNHYYSHKSNWNYEAAKNMGATLINNKIIIFPQNIAKGISYYLPVMEDISITLLDAVFTKDVILKRVKSDDDLYILQFDLSEKINPVKVINPKQKSIQDKFKSGFSVFHTSIGNTFKPIKNQRIFALRLLIDRKKLLNILTEQNKSLKSTEKKILFYNHINGNSKLLINSIKEKSVFDLDFEFYIKGISLKLLANFIETYKNPTRAEISQREIIPINSTHDYLMNNLYENFPSIEFLSKMARMSMTKYKVFFKKIYHTSPNQFFNTQKMILANQLLQSGAFSSINEVSQILNYSKLNYFTTKYTNHFGRNPSVDFNKK